jgi:hypothetical protein
MRIVSGRRGVSVLVLAIVSDMALVAVAQRPDAFTASRDDPSIQYSTRAEGTEVTRLNQDLAAGKARLTFDTANGYLGSLLSALGISIESQMLVFSQASAQAEHISLKNPRAIFFSDATAVGWVRGTGAIEIASQDPRQGTIFYELEQKPVARPQLKRRDADCLQCHLTWDTLGVPGWTAISTFPMSDDKNAYATGVVMDHRTDLNQRWGGWFVTGKAVPVRHLGNLPVVRTEAELSRPAPLAPVLTSVSGTFDTKGYPSAYSDIAALMALEHQTHMTNLITRLGWEARYADHQKQLGHPVSASRMDEAVNDFVDYMLFVDEAPLPRKLEGSSGFAEKFSGEGPKDHQGRSLRQLDMERHLFRYPCSYMIYAPAFDALPANVLDAVYRRLWSILSGREAGKRYDRLQVGDRRAVVEILRDTKKNLPEYFQTISR